MRVLQIGDDDWSKGCRLPSEMEWVFVAADAGSLDTSAAAAGGAAGVDQVAVAILDAPCRPALLRELATHIAPHTLVMSAAVAASLTSDQGAVAALARLAPKVEPLSDRQSWVEAAPLRFFRRQFGQKLGVRQLALSPLNTAGARYEGSTCLAIELPATKHGGAAPHDLADPLPGSEQQDGGFRQIAMWRENIAYERHRVMELWPEYRLAGDCEVELVVQLIRNGTADDIVVHRGYRAAELAEPIEFQNDASGYLSCAIFARGTGTVRIGPLHYRHARPEAGHFLPGGERLVDDRREELFTYFHPGNLKPPLNVYFAGYRQAEGFEGYSLMAGLKHPFLLVTDPRLEGGRFYLGSEALETQLSARISATLERLGFTERDVIFSGLSMGSFGALYYGSRCDAHAVIVGKPIVDLAYLAGRARLDRPNGFLTSLDIVRFWDGGGGTASAAALHSNMMEEWRGDPGFGTTRILMSYMEQDDYDDHAPYAVLESQAGRAAPVALRGYPGRHNDDSAAIVSWFVAQFRRVIAEFEERR